MEQELNFKALEKNLADMVEESQIKLGYARMPIGLYYPQDSICRLLGAPLDQAGLEQALEEFCSFAAERLGTISVSHEGSRFCFRIPEEGVEYVHEKRRDNGFLKEFIGAIGRHGCTFEEILAIFTRYSPHVRCEKMDAGEFDYLLYFEDGVPDDFRYCVKFEGHEAIYHRFTPGDYEALAF